MSIRTVFRMIRRLFCSFSLKDGNAVKDTKPVQQVEPPKTDKKLEILDVAWGHSESKRLRLAIDSSHQPIPWYTYPAIEYLRQLDFSEARVFEWGAGYSSLYWSSVSHSVVSVEDNKEWHSSIVKQAPDNLKIHLIEANSEYEEKILGYNKFDVIIIDGTRRRECAINAIKQISDGGLIILDNSDWYVQAAEVLRRSGLVQVDMSGFGPINDYTWSTSLYFHGSFDLKPRGPRLPMHGAGALDTIVDEDAG